MSLFPMRRARPAGLYDPLRQLHRDVHELFGRLSSGWGWREFMGCDLMFTPALDIREDDQAYTVHVDVPGVDAKDLTVLVENGVLVVRGEKKAEERREGEGIFAQERFYGRFYRELPLPPDADGEHLKASLKQGVLTLTIPKAPTTSRRTIPIEHE